MRFRTQLKRQYIRRVYPLLDNYMPRRLIFLIDLIIILFSVYTAFFLVSVIRGESHDFMYFPWQLLLVIGVQALFFWLFKSYTGIVRYSNLHETFKQFQVVFFCVLSLLIINQVYYAVMGERFITDSFLIIYGFFAFSLLFLFRVVVKGVYAIIIDERPSQTALVLGVQPDDVAMASGLIAQKSEEFYLVGFVDNNHRLTKSDIFGLPIYSMDQLRNKNIKVDAVIVGDGKIKRLQRSDTAILSELLDMGLKVFKLPKLQDWKDVSDSGFHHLRKLNFEDLLRRSPIKLNNKKLFSLYKDKVIMVTGAAGSIGSEIVRQLINFKPKKILLVDQAETPLHELTLELDKKFPEFHYEKLIANVRNRERLYQIFKKFEPDAVFHAAAYKHVPMMEANPIEAISVNFRGTRNVAELAIEFGVERFIFISTDKAVNPTNIMGATKRSAELYIQYLTRNGSLKTNFITTRFGNVLGSNGSVVPLFRKQIEAGGPITVTHPEITRYFMTIDEACQLVLEAGGMGKGGEIFVFDMGKPVKIVDLAKQMIRISGFIPNKDIKIRFSGLRPGEKLYEELLADKENTTATHHEKIMIGRASCEFEDKHLLELCDSLLGAVNKYEEKEAIRMLKTLVPEYHTEKSGEIDKSTFSEYGIVD